MDGGAWNTVATSSGTARAYQDTSTSANHAYEYRVIAYYGTTAGGSYKESVASAASNKTYNTPAAPGTPTATRTTQSNVSLTWSNPGLTETAVRVQQSTDGSTWADTVTISGEDITNASVSPGGGRYYFRVRNERGSLVSAWSSASNAVDTIVAPAAPTLTTPTSGTPLVASASTVVFAWVHNSLDSSAQTAYQMQISTDNGSTWTAYDSGTVTTSSQTVSHTMQGILGLTGGGLNHTYLWRIRTKGAAADWSPWASAYNFAVYQVPAITITSPATDGWVLDSAPLTVQWSYSDPSGTQAYVRLSLDDGTGEKYVKVITGTGTSYTIAADEYLLTNDTTYTIKAIAVSTTALQAEALRNIVVDYEEPALPFADVVLDDALGKATLTLNAGDENAQIRFDGSNWVDTQLVPTATMEFEVVGAFDVPNITADSRIMGAVGISGGGLTPQVDIYYSYTGLNFRAYRGSVRKDFTTPETAAEHTFSILKDGSGALGFYVDGVQGGTNWTTAPTETQFTLSLAARHTGASTYSSLMKGYIRSFRAWDENGVLVADMRPVASGSTVYSTTAATADGFYDVVRGIYCYGGTYEGLPQTVSLGAWRVNPDGSMISLGQNLPLDSTVIDLWPPTDVDYTYRIVAYTAIGLTSEHDIPARINGKGAVYFNFGEDYETVAKLIVNQAPNWSQTNSVTLFETAGDNPDPLAFFGVRETYSGHESGTAHRWRDLYPAPDSDPGKYADVVALGKWHGDVIIRRSKEAAVLAAITNCSKSGAGNRASMAVDWQRVRNHGLAL
jgi:hypothetical protein